MKLRKNLPINDSISNHKKNEFKCFSIGYYLKSPEDQEKWAYRSAVLIDLDDVVVLGNEIFSLMWVMIHLR